MFVKFQILCLCIALSLSFCVSQEQVDFEYSRCNEGKDSCRDCYAELVRAVFGNDDNVFSLNGAFFPTRTNPAEFVVVMYHFKNESMDESAVWFWTEQSSYLLHPLHTFQFLSLFFGKPEAFYTQEADVTLNATDCWGVDGTHLELLTQRLKTYVQRQSIFPLIDNTYSAKAVNNTTLETILQKNWNQITSIVVGLQCSLFMLILVVVVIVMTVHGCSHKWCITLQKLQTANVHFRTKQASIVSVVIVSYVIILYIFTLDIAALARRDSPFNEGVKDIHKKKGEAPFHPFTLLYEIPGIVIAFDLLGALISVVMTIVSAALLCCKCEKCTCKILCCNSFFFLCLSTLGFVCCIVTHIPFVAIAYLNDAYHAGSMFVYYTIIILVSFAVLEQLIASCIKFDHKKFVNDCCSSSNCCCLCTTIIVAIAIVSILSIIAILTSYFVIIPINRSISDAPNRLVGIYESAIILVGAYIAYKAFFKAKKYLERSVVKRKKPINPNANDSTNGWKDISEEEKLAQFYDVIVDIIVDKNRQCRQQATLPPNTNTVSANEQSQDTQPHTAHTTEKSNIRSATGTTPGGQSGATAKTTRGKPADSHTPEEPATQSATGEGESGTESAIPKAAGGKPTVHTQLPDIHTANVEFRICQGIGDEGQPATGSSKSAATGGIEHTQPPTAIHSKEPDIHPASAREDGVGGERQPADKGGQHDSTPAGEEIRAESTTQEDTASLSSNEASESTYLVQNND